MENISSHFPCPNGSFATFYVCACGLLVQPEWLTSLSLNKASLLLVVYNKRGKWDACKDPRYIFMQILKSGIIWLEWSPPLIKLPEAAHFIFTIMTSVSANLSINTITILLFHFYKPLFHATKEAEVVKCYLLSLDRNCAWMNLKSLHNWDINQSKLLALDSFLLCATDLFCWYQIEVKGIVPLQNYTALMSLYTAQSQCPKAPRSLTD